MIIYAQNIDLALQSLSLQNSTHKHTLKLYLIFQLLHHFVIVWAHVPPNIFFPHHNLVTSFFKSNHDRLLVFFRLWNEWFIRNVKVRSINNWSFISTRMTILLTSISLPFLLDHNFVFCFCLLQNLNCKDHYLINLMLATAYWRNIRKIVYTAWTFAESSRNKVTNNMAKGL